MNYIVPVLLALLLISVGAIGYMIVLQQGRILLRLDALENRLFGGGGMAPEPQGLEVGSEIDAFAYPGLDGKDVSLSDFGGKKVLLVNWSPHCGFCDMIADELAEAETLLQTHNTQLILLSGGDVEANRENADEHGLKCPVLIQPDDGRFNAFESFGTPVAYLLDEQHKVAEPIAIGANSVPALVRKVAGIKERKGLDGERSVKDSKIEREGLKPGTPAPTFSLTDLRNGASVSLEDYRGKSVVLVLSDPQCGPCDELNGQLNGLSERMAQQGGALILVSRGDPEENKKKLADNGFTFPFVLQKKWELSKQYGIFATPVGFLIDEQGLIEKEVAMGPEAIAQLVSGPRPAVAAS